jgi:hypothetical protein
MKKRKTTTKRATAKTTRVIKLMTWRRGRTDDVLVRVDTYAATEGGITRLEAALARRIGRAFWTEV